MKRSRLSYCLAVLLALTGCGGNAEPEGPRVPDPAQAVRAFDPDELDVSIDRLNRASFASPSAVRSLALLLGDPDPDRRWAAVYLVAILVTEEQAEVLRPVLEDSDPNLRVMAAGALSRLGVVESLPVLIEGLRSEETLPFSDPPRPTADLAREALEAYTGEGFVSPEEWEQWWIGVRASLTWDGERFVPA
jgi:HEAT repeats